jgi:hypothetical protein
METVGMVLRRHGLHRGVAKRHGALDAVHPIA